MATKKDTDAGQDQVDAAVEQELAQGYRGQKVDPTPDSHYTVAGVIAGKPTPETENAGQPRTHTTTSTLPPDVRSSNPAQKRSTEDEDSSSTS